MMCGNNEVLLKFPVAVEIVHASIIGFKCTNCCVIKKKVDDKLQFFLYLSNLYKIQRCGLLEGLCLKDGILCNGELVSGEW